MNILDKLITHSRDDDGDFGSRVVVHIPAGFLMGLLDWANGFTKLFIYYEKNEDAHHSDEAWKDVFGAMVGWVMGRIVLIGLVIYLIRRFVL